MDLLYGLRGVGAENTEDAIIEDEIENKIDEDLSSVPGLDSGRMPTSEELLSMLDEITGLSDEDRESLRDELTKSVRGENNFGETVSTTPFSSQALILLALLAVIALIFVFFGYKLYKSLIERERKREEKRKLKQMKKKK